MRIENSIGNLDITLSVEFVRLRLTYAEMVDMECMCICLHLLKCDSIAEFHLGFGMYRARF